jgi:uncharacterized protein YlzI (FlbEa/FlbD family)
MPERMDFFIRRLKVFLFNDIFSVLFCMLIPDIILTVMNGFLYVKEQVPKILEKVFLISF